LFLLVFAPKVVSLCTLPVMHVIASRVGPAFLDGEYDLVPRIGVKEEEPLQQEEVAAADQQAVEQSLTQSQAQGKPRCMNLILNYPHLCLYTCALGFRSWLEP
jgi:hypothetical protein